VDGAIRQHCPEITWQRCWRVRYHSARRMLQLWLVVPVVVEAVTSCWRRKKCGHNSRHKESKRRERQQCNQSHHSTQGTFGESDEDSHGGREKYGPFDVDVITLTLYFDDVEEAATGTFWCVRTRLRLRSLWRRICHPHSKAKLTNFSESYWRWWVQVHQPNTRPTSSQINVPAEEYLL